MYLISAYFDDHTNRILQKHIEGIARVTGNSFMLDHNVPPHLTITSIEARSGEYLLTAFEQLCQNMHSDQISLISIGSLLPYVLYVTPVLNTYLQKLQELSFQTFQPIPETQISRLCQPFQWFPHVTLGKTLTQEQLTAAFSYLQTHFAPIHGKIISLGLASTNPHTDLMRITLPDAIMHPQ